MNAAAARGPWLRSHAPWRRQPWVVLALLVAVLAIAPHLLIVAKGPHWRSPLLAGEWLFNVVFVLAIFTYCLALGRRLCGPLARLTGDALADGLAAMALGFGILASAILGAGFLHLYEPPVFLVAFALLTFVLRHELATIGRETAETLAARRRSGLPIPGGGGLRIVLVLLALSLAHMLLRSMVPLADWDGVVYHVASVKIYLAQHAMIALPDMPLANAPAAEEMFYLVCLMAHTDGIGKVLNIGFAVLLALAVYVLARRLAGRPAGWYAALLLLSSIWIVQVMPETFTDFASAFLLVAAACDLIAWVDREAQAGDPDRHLPPSSLLVVRAGLLAGCSAATKLSSLPALPALCATTALCAFLLAGPDLRQKAGAALRSGSLSGAAGLLAVSPWLLKNLYLFQKPFYPYGSVTVSDPTTADGQFIAATPVSTLQHGHWLVDSTVHFLISDAGLASLALIPALFLLRRPAQRAALCLVALLLLCWFLYVPYFAPPRYFIGVTGIVDAVAVASAFAVCRSIRLPERWLRHALLLYLLARGVYLVVAEWTLLGGALLGPVLRGQISSYEYLARDMRPYQAEMWVNGNTPAGAEIAVVNAITGYYLDRPYLVDWYGTRFAHLNAGPRSRHDEFALWCRAGVHYVVFDRGNGRPAQDDDRLPQPLRSFAWIRTPGLNATSLYSAQGVDVLHVEPCAAARKS